MALPFLPGNTFQDPTRRKYHVSQSLGYKNGYALADRPQVGIGGDPLTVNHLTEEEINELNNKRPTLTYGQAKQAPPEDFVPAHVAFDKKVLKFDGYYKQTVHESPNEYFRVRPVVIFYYLEDDSISVVEPHVENSGMPQGKLIKRQRLPKNDQGDHWHWKDLNLDKTLTFYGKVFHVVGCDQWTAEFMASEGIELSSPSTIPPDPYIESRKQKAALKEFKTPSDFDKLKQFIELDRQVLRFYCIWDDRNNMFGELRPYIIQYYLVDDTVEICECHEPNDGRDPFPIFLRRQRLPKDRNNVESSFPSVVMELSNNEIKEWFAPKDFMIGETVVIYHRHFLIYDCDEFTRSYLYQKFGIKDFTPLDVKRQDRNGANKTDLPPYNGFGSLEDSLQSCLSLVPQPPKKDFIKMLENDHKILRFEAEMDSVKPEDRGRRFIISYRLADDMITIFEPPVRNSGNVSGKFLERTRVTKPTSTPEHPQFYGPQDLYIGARIQVFSHRFKIMDADDYVLRYLEARRDDFPGCEKTIESIRTLRGATGGASMKTSVKGAPMKVQRSPGDLQALLREVKTQLKKNNYINFSSLTDAFLQYDRNRSGTIDLNELKKVCHKQNLPLDDDVMQALINECGVDQNGQISHAGFMKFLTWD